VKQSKQVLEWQAEALAETLVEVLQTKFGGLPEDLDSTLRALTSMARLKALLSLAALAHSLEQFRRDAKL
jgi:hypothetical protein